MALSKKVGSFALNTSTGNQSVTGVGFQPKVIIFTMTFLTADGSVADSSFMFGVAVSSTDRRVVCSCSDDAVATSVTNGIHDDTKCIILANPAGTVQAAADFVSMDADGFTISLTTATPAYIVNYLALGGADLTGYKTGSFAESTSLVNVSVTGVGFQPEAIIFFETRATITAPPTGAGSSVSYGNRMGFAVSSTQEFAMNTRERNAQATMEAFRYQRTNRVTATLNSGNIVDSDAEFVSMDADGFTINMTDVAGAAYLCFYLALAGGQYKVGNFTQKTSTGTDAITGVGFQPEALILGSFGNVATTLTVDNARMSLGMATSTTERCCIWHGSDGAVADSVCDSNLDRASVMKFMTEGTPTTEAVADISSLNSDGFTLNWTTADATAREIGYLAIAGDPAVSGGVIHPLYLKSL